MKISIDDTENHQNTEHKRVTNIEFLQTDDYLMHHASIAVCSYGSTAILACCVEPEIWQ